MSQTELIIRLITFAIPGVLLFASVYYFTVKWAEIQREKMKLAVIEKSPAKVETPDFRKHFFPMQVEAVQRMVLFLERIAPNNMISNAVDTNQSTSAL